MSSYTAATRAHDTELVNRRLAVGLALSVLLHALVLSLQFGIPALKAGNTIDALTVTLAPPVPAAPAPAGRDEAPSVARQPVEAQDMAATVEAQPLAAGAPPAAGMRLVDPVAPLAPPPVILVAPKQKRAHSRRHARAARQGHADGLATEVIAQEKTADPAFTVPQPVASDAPGQAPGSTTLVDDGKAQDAQAPVAEAVIESSEVAPTTKADEQVATPEQPTTTQEEQAAQLTQQKQAEEAEEAEAARLAQQRQADEERAARLAQQKQAEEADAARLAQQKQAEEADAARLAQQQQVEEADAARLAQQKQAEEAEAARLAQQQQVEEADAARLAQQKQAEEAEAARLAQQKQAEEAEAARLAQQRQDKQDQAARLAQQRQAEAEQAARLAQQQQQAEREHELARQRQQDELARQRQEEQARLLAQQQEEERQLALQRAAEQERARQLAQQRAAEEQLARQREQEEAARKLEQQRQAEAEMAHLAARQQEEELAQQRAAEQQAASRRAHELAQQQSQALANTAGPARMPSALEPAVRAAGEQALSGLGGAAAAGNGAGTRTGGGLSGDMLRSDVANRARSMLRGLDILGGAPPAVSRVADQARRRIVARMADLDVALRMYVDSIREKIERNGTLNRGQLSSDSVRIDPLVSIAIRSDGSVEDVVILRSSGHPATDEAVRRIVRLNARYSAFPPNVAARYDVVEIRRVWTFAGGLKLLEEVR